MADEQSDGGAGTGGASREPPEIDEFAGIEPVPRRRSPIMAVVVIALGVVLSVHLRGDLRYALQPRTPVDLGDARTIVTRGVGLHDNSYVTLSGQSDRRNSLFIEPRGEKARQSFFRLLGTGTRLLVRAQDTVGRPAIEERWTGRLRRFDELPYATSLRDYYKSVQASRYFPLSTLRAALSGQGAGLHDRAGEPITLRPDDGIGLDLTFPDQIEVVLSREKFPSEPDARHELDRLGLAVSPGREAPDGYYYMVYAPPAQRNAVVRKLDDAQLEFGVGIAHLQAKLSDLRIEGDALLVPTAADQAILYTFEGGRAALLPRAGDRVRVPLSLITTASLSAPIQIADDAFVLVEGESPQEYWWAPVVQLLIAAFVLFNLWYLGLALRRQPR